MRSPLIYHTPATFFEIETCYLQQMCQNMTKAAWKNDAITSWKLIFTVDNGYSHKFTFSSSCGSNSGGSSSAFTISESVKTFDSFEYIVLTGHPEDIDTRGTSVSVAPTFDLIHIIEITVLLLWQKRITKALPNYLSTTAFSTRLQKLFYLVKENEFFENKCYEPESCL